MRDVQTTRIIGRRPPLARWLNMAAGAWLVISAEWVWRTPEDVQDNLVIVGLCVAGVAFLAMFMPVARFANTVLATWLLVSGIAIYTNAPSAVRWNAIVVAIVVLLASLPRDYRRTIDPKYVERWSRRWMT